MWLSKVTIQVWPSGGALAAIAAPIAPAAPGLLSITMFQPVLSATLAARMRATGSVVPPGGKGTTTRIGPFGQSLPSARAMAGTPNDAATLPASMARRGIPVIATLPGRCSVPGAYHLFQPVHQLVAHGLVVLRDLHDAEIFLDRQALVRDRLRHVAVGVVADLLLLGVGRLGQLLLVAVAHGRELLHRRGAGIQFLVGDVRGLHRRAGRHGWRRRGRGR